MPTNTINTCWGLWPVALVAALLGGSCATPPTEPTPSPRRMASSDLISLDAAVLRDGRVEVSEVRKAGVPDVLRVTGRIGVDENRTSRVGAIVDGRIARVLANVGDRVTKGQRLAELQSHEVDLARSDYTKAHAELDRRKAELQFARNAHKRALRLYELKAGSLEQLQRAETDLKAAEMAITSAEADLGRVEEYLAHLGLSVDGALEEYSTARARRDGQFEQTEMIPVLAPLSGTVLKRMVSPGTVVTPAIDLFVVSDLSNLWINAEVSEKHLAQLKVGTPVQILVQAYKDETFSGRIFQIGDTLDPDTRTVQVRCQANNSHERLKPEMYATVTFELGERAEALVIPAAAIQDVAGATVVFVQQGENLFRSRTIRVGRQAEDLAEILEGLKAGEKVAAKGSFLVKSELLKKQLTEE